MIEIGATHEQIGYKRKMRKKKNNAKKPIERLDYKPRRVSLSLPVWMVDALDKKASRITVHRQSLIKMWVVERLDKRI